MVITLTGDNEYLIKSELKKISQDFKKTYGDLAVEVFEDNSELESVYQAINNPGLFASAKLVVLHGLSANKEFAEKVDAVVGAVSGNITLVFVEPKIDKRSLVFKILSKKTDFRTLSALDPLNTTKWIISYTHDNKGEVSQTDAKYLSERVGVSQLKLKNELDKLMLHDPKISRETITLLTEDSYQNNIFQLIEAAFSGRVKQALSIFNNLRLQKIEPVQIIATLSWQLNILAVVKYAKDKNTNKIAADSKQKPYTISKSLAIADKISLLDLKEIIAKLFKIDVDSKSLNSDTDEALKNFILELANY